MGHGFPPPKRVSRLRGWCRQRGYHDDLFVVDHGYESLIASINDKVPQQRWNDVLQGLEVEGIG